MKLLIKNGWVIDPIAGINEIADLCVEGNKIVEEVNGKVKVIDAKGKVVMPAGVDIHTHVAGGKVNVGRLFRPEDSLRFTLPRRKGLRSGSGYSVPSTFLTGYLYAKMGYSLLVEPAVPPLKARHTHDEFSDTPIVDKLGLLLLGNNEQLFEFISRGEEDMCAPWVAYMLEVTKTYGIKAVNPGGTFAWMFHKNVESLHDPIPHFGITPAEIIKTLIRVASELGLPHPLHLHLNKLGVPGNYDVAIETIKKFKPLHAAHLQFSCYGGDSWRNFESEAPEVAKAVNRAEDVTVDLGQVVFGDTTTMTADGPFEFYLSSLTGMKWSNLDVEDETGGGVVPYIYRSSSAVNAVQWAIGLELALCIKNPWKVFLSTDHPNAGPFVSYPKILGWLVDKEFREKEAEGCHRAVFERSSLGSLERELSLEEVAIMTRSGAARRLGLEKYASFLDGSYANIAIYNLNPEPKGEEVERAFGEVCWLIREGEVIVRNGEALKNYVGKTFYASFPEASEKVSEAIKYRFSYYTVNPANYEVGLEYLPRAVPV